MECHITNLHLSRMLRSYFVSHSVNDRLVAAAQLIAAPHIVAEQNYRITVIRAADII